MLWLYFKFRISDLHFMVNNDIDRCHDDMNDICSERTPLGPRQCWKSEQQSDFLPLEEHSKRAVKHKLGHFVNSNL